MKMLFIRDLLGAVLGAALATTVSAGCSVRSVECVRISADGRTIAYALDELMTSGLYPNLSASWSNDVQVCWCGTKDPGRVYRAPVHHEQGFSPPAATDGVADLLFSPDGNRLAIVTSRKVLVLDLASGNIREVFDKPGSCPCASWIGNDELGFGAWEPPEDAEKPISGFRLYRARVSETSALPSTIFTLFPERKAAVSLYWSPRGRYAFLVPRSGGNVLYDVQRRERVLFQPIQASFGAIAWKKDESAVLCPRLRPYDGDSNHAREDRTGVGPPTHPAPWPAGSLNPDDPDWVMVGMPDGNTVELGAHDYAGELEWTADGAYVICRGGWGGIWLIRPAPWAAFPLKDKIVSAMKLVGNTHALDLRALPVPGWLWTRGADGRCYAMDYEGRQFIPITEGGAWAITPDGRRIAEVGRAGEVNVRELALPPPASSATAATSPEKPK